MKANVVSFILLAYSGLAYAQPAALDRHDVPTWEMLTPYVLGLALAMVSAYARGLSGRVTRIERAIDENKADSNKQVADIKERLFTQYHDIEAIQRAIRAAIEPLQIQISHMQDDVHKTAAKTDAVHSRLDRLRVPSATDGA